MCASCRHRWALHGGRMFERWCIGWDAAHGFCGCKVAAPLSRAELLSMPVADLLALPGVIACSR